MSNVSTKSTSHSVSPTPTVVIEHVSKLLEDYKQSKSSTSKSDVSTSSPSSTRIQNNVSPKIDLSLLSKFLPSERQGEVLTKIVEHYAAIGRLDCIDGISSENNSILDSWRDPGGVDRLEEQHMFFGGVSVDTRMTTTEWGDIYTSSNIAAGRLVPLCPGPLPPQPNQWNRQTDVVEITNIEANIMITPQINLSGSSPNFMGAEEQVVEVMVLCDDWALMSNKTCGAGIAVGMVETIAGNGTAPSSGYSAPFQVFTNGGGPVPNQVYMYPTGMPHLLNNKNRFHILYHERIPIKYHSNWLPIAVGDPPVTTTLIQTPGENVFHHMNIKLDKPIQCPYLSDDCSEPYLNNLRFFIWGNTSTTTGGAYYSICHYNIGVTFRDVGDREEESAEVKKDKCPGHFTLKPQLQRA